MAPPLVRYGPMLHALSIDGPLTVTSLLGEPLSDAASIEEALQETKQNWVKSDLFNAMLHMHADETQRLASLAGDAPGSPDEADPLLRKREDCTEQFTFQPAAKFKDGIYGLYKEFGLDPDRLKRSMRQEFLENDGGAWLPEYTYVVHERSRTVYPSSKGPAPDPKDVPEYTREWKNGGLRLDDFVMRQPRQLRESNAPLTRCEVAAVRLYTGPVFAAWNGWLRGTPYTLSPQAVGAGHSSMSPLVPRGQSGKLDDWATSVAVLNNAVVKLSQISEPAVV